MAYLGNRQVTQYQSIPQGQVVLENGKPVYTGQKSPKHAGGVIDFERNYYGTDFRWTGKELLPNTTLSIGVALDAMDENVKALKILMRMVFMASKVIYAVMKTILYGILTHIYKLHGSFINMAFRYGGAL